MWPLDVAVGYSTSMSNEGNKITVETMNAETLMLKSILVGTKTLSPVDLIVPGIRCISSATVLEYYGVCMYETDVDLNTDVSFLVTLL